MTTETIDARGDIRNLAMVQGNTFSLEITIKDSNGVAIDLTDFDIRAQFRKSFASTTTEINCTLANGKCAITDAVGGKMMLVLAPSDTSGIRFLQPTDETLELVYDVELTRTTDSAIFKPTRGTMTIQREVTR